MGFHKEPGASFLEAKKNVEDLWRNYPISS